MGRTKKAIYVQLLAGILLYTVFLSPSVLLTTTQQVASVIPPNIRAYELIELDGAALRAEVEAGRTVTLEFATQQFEVQLVPHNLLSPKYAARVEPTWENPGTFRGMVVGVPDSIVRLALREGLVRGYVLTGTGDWYFIEPVRYYGDPATLGVPWNLHFIYKTTDVTLQLNLSNDVVHPSPLPKAPEEIYSASVRDSSMSASSGSWDQVLDMHFESLEDNQVVDSSWYGHHGTNHGAFFWEGKRGSALVFDGNDYVEVPVPESSPLNLETTSFTIAAWVYIANDNEADTIFFECGDWGGAERNQMILFLITPDRHPKLGFYGPRAKSDRTIPLNQWTHVAVTFERGSSGGYATFYIDGVGEPPKYLDGLPNFGEWRNPLIGRAFYDGYEGAYLHGDLDELQVYRRVLSGSEVAALALQWDAEIIVAYDAEYTTEVPNWYYQIFEVMNAVEGIYYDDLFTFFPIVDIVECDTCTSTNIYDLLDDLKAKWMNNPTERDLVHLFSGKDLQPEGYIGLADLWGLKDASVRAYGVTRHIAVPDSSYTASLYGKTIVVSHEIGHNFGGHHPYAAEQLYVPLDYYYTIMWPGYMGDGWMLAHFSNGRIGSDPNKNNLKRMIPYACDNLPD